MKKFYVLLIVLIAFFANAQVINIPDANFKAKLLASSPTNPVGGNSGGPIQIDANSDGEIQQSEALAVTSLAVSNSNISDLTGLEYFSNLTELYAINNQLTTFSQNGLPNLYYLWLTSNNLTTVDLSGHTSIHTLLLDNNHISSLLLNGCNNLEYLECVNNNLTALDLSECPRLHQMLLNNNELTSIQFANNSTSDYAFYIRLDNNLFETLTGPNHEVEEAGFNCSNNPNLRYLNLKDTSRHPVWTFWEAYNFSNCPQLEYVCVREQDITAAQTYVSPYPNCHVNTYCSFTPGGTFYTIDGTNRFDSNTNGCDSADGQIPNMKYIISNGLASTTLVADNDGSYHYDVQAGTYTITPVFENQNYFTATPTSSTVTFPADTSPFIQNFCVTANSYHDDLEVALLPIGIARPGFDATYKIIYKNNGTHIQNDSAIFLSFDDSVLDLVSATPSVTSQTTNNLRWDYSNLLPFETREITFVLNLYSPTETPALNAGDVLNFNAFAWATVAEETIENNSAVLNQVVVNSLDPNDKTCAEGGNLSVEEVGKYLHYIIRFENTGNANAENIVVKDMIDTTKFDISTLVPLHGSHAFETRISSTNKVEFIFENINLPFDNDNNDGYVAFKIKTHSNLVEGDAIVNSANIYFDYNFPIVTDPYTVNVYNPLSTSDFDFGSIFILSPVPAKNSLTITTKQNVVMSSVNIYNTLGQLIQVNTNPSETIDVSGLKTGSYFIKIISDKGTASSKFVK